MIFNLFKAKPTLKELIPEGFVDIHSHLLPGIDDGAKNIEESINIINMMKNLGYSKLIATPHIYPGLYENNRDKIKQKYTEVEKKIRGLNIDLNFAAEYLINKSLIKEAEERELLTIQKKYVLLEMSYLAQPLELYETLFKIQINGYIPILAHPERYTFLFSNFSEYYKLKKRGCQFQLNLLSTTGCYGKKISSISERLLKEKLIDFVGSDIHNIKHANLMKTKLNISSIKQLVKAINKTQEKFSGS